jgi:hypothetical protein
VAAGGGRLAIAPSWRTPEPAWSLPAASGGGPVAGRAAASRSSRRHPVGQRRSSPRPWRGRRRSTARPVPDRRRGVDVRRLTRQRRLVGCCRPVGRRRPTGWCRPAAARVLEHARLASRTRLPSRAPHAVHFRRVGPADGLGRAGGPGDAGGVRAGGSFGVSYGHRGILVSEQRIGPEGGGPQHQRIPDSRGHGERVPVGRCGIRGAQRVAVPAHGVAVPRVSGERVPAPDLPGRVRRSRAHIPETVTPPG